MVRYGLAVTRLSSLFESPPKSCLTLKADIFLRLYINTGTLNASLSSPNTATPKCSITTASNSFTGTCPFTINYLCDTSAKSLMV
jgi:hypothetical protein